MTDRRNKIIDSFRDQETGFKHWLKSYYETALELELLKRETSRAEFIVWIADTFRADQIDVIEDMLAKLHKTDTGKAILKSYAETAEFIFPS